MINACLASSWISASVSENWLRSCAEVSTTSTCLPITWLLA
ncbi:Uncharacterised protein [Vibrio cholerae]|nr:Uncharacterised protein [Vibrio cholerae]CSI11952.1 Uncharacterised protein [Vibrio cholerae]CSI86467.1 Uncharacterised protein [Vibrio cholerae]